MAVESVYFTETDDGSPLSEDELMVNFLVLKPQHPQEEHRLYAFRVLRRLLASEESSKTFVPHLLSNTNIPHLFHDCPRFVEAVSYSVGSLPGDTNHLNVYNVVLDVAETVPESLWVFNFMREKPSTSTKEEVKLEVEDPSDCAIYLQELQAAGTEAATILPCSHIFHPSCVLSWFLRSDNCPLCRSRSYVAIASFDM
ncbi:hypothetical protein F2P56_001792 [Juglans regia]|uniref:RING-type domain-containing protein n=2 Tax=Juglans regia TaxID=51240 RepID=A0A833XZX8_JUGRE|nr:uncharacterized protein LOC109021479 [Juglans regia]KAF5481112.1 hypothetical protein F2P56_001792 [Juglans regia]